MKTEHEKMKSAIGRIMAELQPGDRMQLRAVIEEAAEVAGFGPRPRAPVGPEVLSLVPGCMTAVDPSLREYEEVLEGGARAPGVLCRDNAQALTLHMDSLSAQGGYVVQGPSSRKARRKRAPNTERGFVPHPMPDPFQCAACSEGMAVILPFFGPAAFTFSGRIFWRMMEMHEATSHADDSPSLVKQRLRAAEHSITGTAHGDMDSFRAALDMGQTCGQGLDPVIRESFTLLEKRLQSAREGRCSPEKQVKAQLRASHPAQATSGEMLSLLHAEKRFREAVGDDVFAVVAQPAVDHWEARHRYLENPGGHDLIDGFFDRLFETSICTGGGPQWRSEVFDECLQEWVRLITSQGCSFGNISAVC